MNKIIVVLSLFMSSLSGAQNLSVLTYNLKYDNPSDAINSWDSRKEFLISQLNYNRPDVFGTQEGLYNQLEDIKKGLDGYEYFGQGRDFGDNRGEFTAVFYNYKKVKCITNGTFWLSETPEQPSKGWDAAFKRTCTYGTFEELHSSKRFMVFNIHFDHVGDVARKESADLLLKKIELLNPKRLPVILMGDFNLEANTTGIQNILKYYKDSHIEAGKNAFGPAGTFNGFYFDQAVTRKIDYIFFSGKMDILKSGILSDSKDCRYPSDHFPIYVELNLSK